MKTDIVVDLAYGDCAKGKVTHYLLKNKKYSHSIRFNGGSNAGHTIYHDGKKVITHLIPAGVFFGVRSIIGPGCVLNVESFFQEIEELKAHGIEADSLIKVADTVHIITDEHIKEDQADVKIGTTKRGVGPAYRDKYNRTGIQAKSIPALKKYLVDFHQEIFSSPDNVLICEGAQGFYLDPHFGDYPYVTSSHCTVAGALLNGIPHTSIRLVFGCIKAYDTYVGAKKFQPDGEIFNQLCKAGNEVGATTGRVRQCNFLNIDLLKKAVKVNAVHNIVVNKMDVLQTVGVWKVIKDDQVLDLKSEENFIQFMRQEFDWQECHLMFSYSPETI